MNALSVQSASVDITPHHPLGLFGRSDRSVPYQTVASRLEANCLWLGDAAFVTLDTLYPSQALVEGVIAACARLGLTLDADALLMVASHTHNAPALDDTKPSLGAFDAGYLTFVADRIAACLKALAELTAGRATLSQGAAPCAAAVFRRKRIAGLDVARLKRAVRTVMAPNTRVAIDHDLKLYLLRDEDDAVQCAIWSWPCHAVSEPDKLAISADFPGAVRDRLRQIFANPSLPVLYLPGFSGDIRPAFTSWLPLHKSGRWLGLGPRFARNSAGHSAKLQAVLFEAVEKAAAAQGAPVDIASVGRKTREIAIDNLRDNCVAMAPLTCHDWAIGPLMIKAVSAEVASAYATPDPMRVETGCANQVFGYIPTDTQLPEGGYEVSGFAPAFGVAGAFKDHIEDPIRQLIGSERVARP